MFLYRNIRDSSFKLYSSSYSIYIVKLVDLGNLVKCRCVVELYDLFGNRYEISKLDLINNYVDTKFKRIKLYRYKYDVCYIVLKKEKKLVYGCYVGNKVKINSKFGELHGTAGMYVVCNINNDGNNKIDRTSYCGLDKRLFRAFYKPYKNSETKRVVSVNSVNTKISKKLEKSSSSDKIELLLKHRLVDSGDNLKGFSVVDNYGNVSNLTLEEVINICANKTNTKVLNAAIREVNNKRYLYGLGMSLKDLPSLRV